MHLRWNRLRKRPSSAAQTGLHYDAGFLKGQDRAELLAWLEALHPLWEYRFSQERPLPAGETQRQLLRPVYWMGSWQFACLDYYRPPKGALNRAIRSEPYPPVMARLVREIETRARKMFRGPDLPEGWSLTTCLVNFYGRRKEGEKWIDVARVGEHKDFEPGPVASLSLGERALFQFVKSRRPGERDGVVSQQWLDDGSLQIFGGEQWKRQTFHRVLRVDRKEGHRFVLKVPEFETRRVNFTFRFVPDEHVTRFAALPPESKRDVEGYMKTLAAGSPFFARELGEAG